MPRKPNKLNIYREDTVRLAQIGVAAVEYEAARKRAYGALQAIRTA